MPSHAHLPRFSAKVGHAWFPAVQSAGVYQHAKTMFLCPAEEAGRLPASRCSFCSSLTAAIQAALLSGMGGHARAEKARLGQRLLLCRLAQTPWRKQMSYRPGSIFVTPSLSGFRDVCRQPELVSTTLTALSKIALAEAQTVTAARAAAICATPALVASIHVGIAGASAKAVFASFPVDCHWPQQHLPARQPPALCIMHW